MNHLELEPRLRRLGLLRGVLICQAIRSTATVPPQNIALRHPRPISISISISSSSSVSPGSRCPDHRPGPARPAPPPSVPGSNSSKRGAAPSPLAPRMATKGRISRRNPNGSSGVFGGSWRDLLVGWAPPTIRIPLLRCNFGWWAVPTLREFRKSNHYNPHLSQPELSKNSTARPHRSDLIRSDQIRSSPIRPPRRAMSRPPSSSRGTPSGRPSRRSPGVSSRPGADRAPLGFGRRDGLGLVGFGRRDGLDLVGFGRRDGPGVGFGRRVGGGLGERRGVNTATPGRTGMARPARSSRKARRSRSDARSTRSCDIS